MAGFAGLISFVGAIMALLLPPTVVTFSATPTFDGSLGNYFRITLTGNVTSSTLSNCSDGELIIIEIIQNATGGWTFVWPTNIVGGMDLSGAANDSNLANIVVTQVFIFDNNAGKAYPLAPGSYN